jgi:hypothetical protein
MTGVRAIVRWSLSTSSNGLGRYDLQVSVDGAAFVGLTLPTPTTPSRWTTLLPGHRYTFRARAVDLSGRVGAWRTVGPVAGAIISDGSAAVAYSRYWSTTTYVGYIGGRAHYTRARGAIATLRWAGSSISVIGPVGPGRGRSAIYLDGVLVATIDQVAVAFAPRRVLFARSLASGTHTILVKALGTSGRPMVAIDALEVLMPT